MHGVVPGSVLATLAGAVAGLLGSRVDGTGAVRLTAHPTQASKRAQAKRVPSAPSAMWKRARCGARSRTQSQRRLGEQSADKNGPAGASPRPEREPRGRGSAAAERRREAWSRPPLRLKRAAARVVKW